MTHRNGDPLTAKMSSNSFGEAKLRSFTVWMWKSQTIFARIS